MDFKSKRFKLSVVVSILYLIILSAIIAENAYYFFQMVEMALLFGAPVWVYWVMVWIWPERVEVLFRRRRGSDEYSKKLLREWVIVDEETAKKHPLYGVVGYPILVAILLIVSPLFYLTELYSMKFDMPPELWSDSALLLNSVTVLVWLSSVLSVFCFLYLINKEEVFQGVFLTVSAMKLTADTMLLIWLGGLMGYPFLEDARAIGGYVGSLVRHALLLWYVYLSARINITTRKRLRRKYLPLVGLKPDSTFDGAVVSGGNQLTNSENTL